MRGMGWHLLIWFALAHMYLQIGYIRANDNRMHGHTKAVINPPNKDLVQVRRHDWLQDDVSMHWLKTLLLSQTWDEYLLIVLACLSLPLPLCLSAPLAGSAKALGERPCAVTPTVSAPSRAGAIGNCKEEGRGKAEDSRLKQQPSLQQLWL